MTKNIAGYAQAIDWIAYNDETSETSVETLAQLISVMMVADLFDRSPEAVAQRVLDRRPHVLRAAVRQMRKEKQRQEDREKKNAQEEVLTKGIPSLSDRADPGRHSGQEN